MLRITDLVSGHEATLRAGRWRGDPFFIQLARWLLEDEKGYFPDAEAVLATRFGEIQGLLVEFRPEPPQKDPPGTVY